MKKKAFNIICTLYFLLGMTGFLKYAAYAYIEQDTWSKVIRDHLFLVIVSSFVSGGLLTLMYIKWQPGLYEARKNRKFFHIYTPLMAMLVAFVFNMGLVFHEDLFFRDIAGLRIKGVVMNKRIIKGSKGRGDYFLSVSDSVTKLNYYFLVKKRIYYAYKREQMFDKTFHVNILGVIYRKED